MLPNFIGFGNGITRGFGSIFSLNHPNNLEFQTLKSDLRKYWKIGKNYTIAVRAFIGSSLGKDKQNFFLGGVPYLLGGRGETNGEKDTGNFREVLTDTSNSTLIHDIYFTEYAWPLRGARFGERFGNNTALFNLEVRFPFINYLFWNKERRIIPF